MAPAYSLTIMFKRIAYLFAILILLLPGCNSFNHETYLELHPSKYVQEGTVTKLEISGLKEVIPTSRVDPKIIRTPVAVQEGSPKNWCPPYHPPKLLPEPVAPADKLAAVKASEVNAIEKISADYIVELHNYIKSSQLVQTKAYNEYVISCRALQKTHK